MSDRLKLSDPKDDAEIARITVTQELMPDHQKFRDLENNIAALEAELAKKKRIKPAPAVVKQNKIGARKQGSFMAISTAPSINKTPVGPSMVPIPYPTVQRLTNSIGTARTVKFNGCGAYVLDSSTQPNCTGDERGTGKGVRSGTVSGEIKPVVGSSSVWIEGKKVVREGDACTMNGGNNPGVYVTPCVASSLSPKTASTSSNPQTTPLLHMLRPKSELQALLRAVQSDTINGNYPHPLPRPTAAERHQIGSILGEKNQAKLEPWDGDLRSPLQKFAEQNRALYDSSMGGAFRGVAKMLGASDAAVSAVGIFGESLDLAGAGAIARATSSAAHKTGMPSAKDGVKILPRQPRPKWTVSPDTLASAAKNKTEIYQAWKKDVGSHYKTVEESVEAFRVLVRDQSPWPAGYIPNQATLSPGTRVFMAMSPGQPNTSPGSFGTRSKISDQMDVRNKLAVKSAWKNEISHMVEYEVIKPLPVKEGPVGPQIDHRSGKYLPGKSDQVNFDIPKGVSRMDYLKIVKVTPLY